MKFLVDAQLPRRLARWIRSRGYDALHTLELPAANATPDQEIIAIADQEQRVIVTKDADFVQSFTVLDKPNRVLLISTGNISNDALETLVKKNFASILKAFEASRFVELSQHMLIVHE